MKALNQLLFLGTACVLIGQPAHAIRGKYLPASELPNNVCKIVIGKMRHILQPSQQNGTALKGVKPVIIDMNDQFVCSSNLIAPDTILTAGHCFQGNNEWKIRKGRFKYPKLTDAGERLPGCEGASYLDKKECVDREEFGTLTMKWIDVRVECPKPDGSGFEVRPLKEEYGYSNPFYRGNAPEMKNGTSISISNFDMSFYKLKNPITSIRPMEVAWDFDQLSKSLIPDDLYNPESLQDLDLCRSFGYGTDNDEKAGILRGANTPLAKLDYGFIESKIDSREPLGILFSLATQKSATSTNVPISSQVPRTFQEAFTSPAELLPSIGYVDHGDSGGALMCRGRNDRHYKLAGVVSRGINRSDIEKMFDRQSDIQPFDPDEAEDMIFTIAKADYSLPAYNKRFIDFALKYGAFPRPLDTKYWYSISAPYVQDQIKSELDLTWGCISDHKNEMTSSTYRMYKDDFNMVSSLLQKAENETAQWGNDPGLFLTKIHEYQVLLKNRQVYWNCRNKSYFSDY